MKLPGGICRIVDQTSFSWGVPRGEVWILVRRETTEGAEAEFKEGDEVVEVEVGDGGVVERRSCIGVVDWVNWSIGALTTVLVGDATVVMSFLGFRFRVAAMMALENNLPVVYLGNEARL